MASSSTPDPLNCAQLAAAGMRMRESCGPMTVDADGWLTIGLVIDPTDADMEIFPCDHATDAHKRRLIAVAMQALVHGQPADGGWTHRPGVGWSTAVQIRYPSFGVPSATDRACRAAATAASSAGMVLVCSGSREPSSL